MKYLLAALLCFSNQLVFADESTPITPAKSVTLTVGPKFTRRISGNLIARIQCSDLQSVNEAYTRDGATSASMNDCRSAGCQYCALLSASIANTDCRVNSVNNAVATADAIAIFQGFNCLP